MRLVKSPFLIVGLIALTVSIVGSFYYLVIEPEGGMALAGVLFLISIFIVAVLLFFEQLLLMNSKFKKKSVWMIESVLLLSVLSLFLFAEREIIYQINDDTKWFVVVEDPSINDKLGIYSFPFNIKYDVPESNILTINPSEIESFHRLGVQGAKSWKGYRGIGRTIEVESKKYSLIIYFPYATNVQEPEIQQILEDIKSKL